MSKVIEALKTGGGEFAPGEHESTQKELAETYFGKGEKSQKKGGEYPMLIKVVERPSTTANLIPWIITSVAFLITAFSLFSTKRILVDVKVIDEKHPFFTGAPQPAAPTARPESASPEAAAPEEETFEGGELAPRRAIFEGAAKLKSASNRSGLTLVNSSVAPFARASFFFRDPIDLSGGKIVFYVKGGRGGEQLAVALKDKDNILAFDKGKFYPFPEGLGTDWQKVEVPLSTAVKDFSARKVTNIRLEFGSNVKNRPGDTILVKDLQVLF